MNQEDMEDIEEMKGKLETLLVMFQDNVYCRETGLVLVNSCLSTLNNNINTINNEKKEETSQVTKMSVLFDKYCDKTRWKNPIKVIVDTLEEANDLRDAITFYHGSRPTITNLRKGFRVTSKGYDCD